MMPRTLMLAFALAVGPVSCIVVGPDGQDQRLDEFDEDGDGFYDVEFGGRDCDDGDPAINPAAEEVCDEIDNDCDGGVDEQLTTIEFVDDDGDGFGDSNQPSVVCSGAAGFASRSGDCDDTDAAINPDAQDVCDGEDNDCDGFADDSVSGTWYADEDGDTFGAGPAFTSCDGGSGLVPDNTDCNDGDDTVYPDAEELCDGLDNNCSGEVDEGLEATSFFDSDNDGFGDPALPNPDCSDGPNYVENNTDCDDGDPSINPAALEVACDSIDNNCDDQVDEISPGTAYPDEDGDGFGREGAGMPECVAPVDWVLLGGDCDDHNDEVYPESAPGAGDAPAELCDDTDNDCNGLVDDGAPLDYTWYVDDDNDGFGQDGSGIPGCSYPASGIWAEIDGDCDDTADDVNPAAPEICDMADNDCDTEVDEWADAGDGRDGPCEFP